MMDANLRRFHHHTIHYGRSNLELFLILLVLHLLSAAAGYTQYRFLIRTKLLGKELSPRHTLRDREYTKHLKLKIEKYY